MDIFKKEVIEKVDKVMDEKHQKLSKQFPDGYTVLGFPSRHGVIITKSFVPNGVEVDWASSKILEVTEDKVIIRFPDINFKGASFKSPLMGMTKKIGVKARLIKTPDWILYSEILAIEKDLIVIAVGFEPIK